MAKLVCHSCAKCKNIYVHIEQHQYPKYKSAFTMKACKLGGNKAVFTRNTKHHYFYLKAINSSQASCT